MANSDIDLLYNWKNLKQYITQLRILVGNMRMIHVPSQQTESSVGTQKRSNAWWNTVWNHVLHGMAQKLYTLNEVQYNHLNIIIQQIENYVEMMENEHIDIDDLDTE